MKKHFTYIVALLGLALSIQCTEKENSLEFKNIFETEKESTSELDKFLKEEFRDPYGSVIRYKFNDDFLRPDQTATPARLDVVKPIAELILSTLIEPYNKAAENKEAFLKRNFPAEIVLIGSPIFDGDGTRLLGVADSGVRITITECNLFDPSPDANNSEWIDRTFRTLHHEFAHIIDQNFNFEFEEYIKISGNDYTSPGGWVGLIENGNEFSEATLNNAVSRGMVSAYGTSSAEEDFAEMVSFLITMSENDFFNSYLIPEECSFSFFEEDIISCTQRNTGRERIRQKVEIITNYLKDDVGIDIAILREEFLKQTGHETDFDFDF